MKKVILFVFVIFTFNINYINAQKQSFKRYPIKKLINDFNYLFNKLEEIHPNCYAYISKEEFEKKKQSAFAKIDKPLTQLEFYKIIAPVFCLIGDGHSQMFPFGIIKELDNYLDNGLLFPLKLKFEKNKVIVLNDYDKIKKGSELLSINNYSIDTIKENILQLYNGETKNFKESFLTDVFNSFLWVVYKFDSTYTLKIRNLDNSTKNYIVTGISINNLENLITDTSNTHYTYSEIETKKGKVAYFDLNDFENPDKFSVFAKETFLKIKNDSIQSLIIDLRHNPGGNSEIGHILLNYINNKPIYAQASKMDVKLSKEGKRELKKIMKGSIPFWAKLFPIKMLLPYDADNNIVTIKMNEETPENNDLRFKGNVYVLIDIYSYSSAIAFSRTVKDYKIGVLVGQETGGYASGYGPATTIKLPHTKLEVNISFMHHYRPSGIDDLRGVIPDYIIQEDSNVSDLDKVLYFTINLINEKN